MVQKPKSKKKKSKETGVVSDTGDGVDVEVDYVVDINLVMTTLEQLNPENHPAEFFPLQV